MVDVAIVVTSAFRFFYEEGDADSHVGLTDLLVSDMGRDSQAVKPAVFSFYNNTAEDYRKLPLYFFV